MPIVSTTSTITVDGSLSDWMAAQRIDNPVNVVSGYSLYGTVQNDTYLIGIGATSTTDPVIGGNTTIWLNTDQNTATGYSPFGSIGADYNVTYVNGAFYLYTGAAAQTLVSATPLTAVLSQDGKSLEIAIPRSSITPAGATAPTNINIAGWINNGAVYLPGDYTNPEYTITDPATLQTQAATHRVAIVYSDTSANLYFSQTAYSDLFMAAQNQARMAGVSYDVIDESKLTDINNLIGYGAHNFPVDGSRKYGTTAGNHVDADQCGLQLPPRHHHGRRLSDQRSDGRSTPRQRVRQHGVPLGSCPGFGRQQRDCDGHRQRHYQSDYERIHRRTGHSVLHQ